MKSSFCEFEEEAAAALSRGQWPEELARHAVTCSQCAELRLVAQFLATVPALNESAPMPTAGLIWWKAQLAERRQHAQRAIAAIDLMQKVSAGVALAVLVMCGYIWLPVDLTVVLLTASLLTGTAAVLYGWVHGRLF